MLGDLPPSEFETWVYDTPELEKMLDPKDYLFFLELDYSSPLLGEEIAKWGKHFFGSQFSSAWETQLLRQKLENALQANFLWMVEVIENLRDFQGYPLTELGIAIYTDADVYNFLEKHSPDQRKVGNTLYLTPPVDESLHEEYFPNFREQVIQAIDWLRTGEIMVVAEGEEGRTEKTYRLIDRRKRDK